MKKYIFMAVAGMLALSSCSNDDNEQTTQNAPRQMTFTAGFGDGASTRATLNGSTKAVTFDAGDKISIFSEHNTDAQEFTTSAGGATATFTGTVGVPGDATYYAIYPYSLAHSYNSSSVLIMGVEIPSSQGAAATSACGWDPAAAIAYATTTEESLTFHNACALLKVTNDSGDGNMIMIQVTEEGLTGIFSLNPSTGALTLEGGVNMVRASDVPNDKTIYLAVAPGTYTNFVASCDGKLKGKASVTLAAGHIYDLGNTSTWPAELTTDIAGYTFYYCAGETWTQAIAYHENNLWNGFKIQGGYVYNTSTEKYLKNSDGSAYIDPDSEVTPEVTPGDYTWGD